MIVSNRFPSQEVKKKLRNFVLDPIVDNIAWPDITIHTKANRYLSNIGESAFSVLSVNGQGNAHIKLNNKELKICKDTFLVLGPFQTFDYLIDHDTPVEVLNFHLGIQSYQDAMAALSLSQETLLNNGLESQYCPDIMAHIHFKSDPFGRLLNDYSQSDSERYIFNVVNYTLGVNAENNRLINNIQGTKNSTKQELFRRMSLARDIIYSQYDYPEMNLEYLSKEVFMSKFHFLRVFKQTFGITPYQMIRDVRINKIFQMVIQKDIDINEIAILTGVSEPNTVYSLYKEALERRKSLAAL
ncbi:helix-turn-helix domain-containing protein [Arenibacter palladensis]|uniref:helix-turn-helix domain-containing protein n=1 Tax=Arenibacter palladensis TaxID=237373 RepID=UPI0026E37194|nr:helix-turn-helix domain-containing protein [Arenibacter palladensis]MDO6602229.1 helix-turn-helix domain-containing protein [Arenibacter palladensis]